MLSTTTHESLTTTMSTDGQQHEQQQTNLDRYTLPLIQKKITQRSCKGPISIKRIDPKGEYIVIENTSIRKPVVLTNWILKRRGVDVPPNSFKFEKHFVLHPSKQVKIYATDKGRNNLPYEIMSDNVISWGVGTYAFTQLVNHLNQEKATLLEKLEHYERELTNASQQQSNNKQHRQTANKNTNHLDFDNYDNYMMQSAKQKQNAGADNLRTDKDYEFYFEKNIWQ